MAGAGAAAGGAGATCVSGAVGIGPGMVAPTTRLQAGERPEMFCCRHSSASLAPGCTPEHFDMKSLRQFWRIAFCCDGVGPDCAAAVAGGAGATAAVAGCVTGRLAGCAFGGGAATMPAGFSGAAGGGAAAA